MKILNHSISFIKERQTMFQSVGFILWLVWLVATVYFPSAVIWFWPCLLGLALIFVFFYTSSCVLGN